MRILVTGAAGMLGRAVVAAAGVRHAVVGVDQADGDLTDPAVAPELLARHRPDWVTHCAAFTDVDGAETARERAVEVNGGATAHLARACVAAAVGMQYISTDYVFNGRDPLGYDEESPRAPVNHYGLTKAQGEAAVEAMPGRWQIARTSWLFGPGPKNFVLAIRERLAATAVLQVVKDQVGCPTYAPDLATVLLFLLENGTPGLYHATNRGACTWFAFAREIARQLGHDPRLIAPCAATDWRTPARRPACSILRSRRLEALGCADRPPWPDALNRYLALLARAGGVAES